MRPLAILGLTLLSASAVLPPFAHAQVVEPTFSGMYHLYYPAIGKDPTNVLSQMLQTALKDGDVGSIIEAIDEPSATPSSMRVDLSELGIADPMPFIDAYYMSREPHIFLTNNFIVDTGGKNGEEHFTITATLEDGTTITEDKTARIDNIPPTFNITSYHFSTTTPKAGDQLFFSGTIDGTGTEGHLINIQTDFLAGDGVTSLQGRAVGAGFEYGTFSNTPFTDYPMTLPTSLPPAAAFLKIIFTIADGAGSRIDAVKLIPLAHIPGPTPPVSNVLFLPGTEASRLYMKDANGHEHQLWEPSFYTDIPLLAMNPDGTNINQIYTKDIVDSIYGNNPAYQFGAGVLMQQDLDTYGGFEKFMDGLVANGTVREWRAYPYDWRYDVRDVVSNGTPTEMSDGSLQQIYLEDVVAELASTSPSGKVTVIGHSNGGLLAKVLAIKLQADGKINLLDKIVMVGTPQFGTPDAIGAVLHGDNFSDMPSFVVHAEDARSVAAGMGDSYDLLPSSAYFSHITDPVVTFDQDGSLSKLFTPNFGAGITSFDSLLQFVEDAFHVDAQIGDSNDIHIPLALTPALADKARATHDALDAWTPPPGLDVTAIAGWGQETIKTLAYKTAFKETCARELLIFKNCTNTPYLQHAPVITQDGDGTVVAPSAVGDIGSQLYFNAKDFHKSLGVNISHQNLTSAPPIQNKLNDLLQNTDVDEPYLPRTKPTNERDPLTVISTHSPVNIIVTDANGNQTGIIPFPGKTDFSFIIQHILDSFVHILDDEKYIYVPVAGIYTVQITGYGEGMTTLDIGSVDENGVASTTTSFANIPTTASTTATFQITDGVSASAIPVDIDGNGTSDITAISGDNTPAPPPPPESPPESPTPKPTPQPTNRGGGGSAFREVVTPLVVASTTTSTSSKPVATSAPPKKTKKITIAPKPIPHPTNIPQTASAYSAIESTGLKNKLYTMWSNFTHTLTSVFTLWK